MKTVNAMIVAATLATATQSGLAAEPAGDYLDVCRSQLSDYYGQDTEVLLIRQRAFQDGIQLRVAARLDQDNSRFATCWVANDEVSGFSADPTREMVAATDVTAAPAR